MEFDERFTYHHKFQHPTTYGNDYRKFRKPEKATYNWSRERTEPPVKPPPPYKPIDGETFVPLRDGSYIPFNLWWEKKPIIQTNPLEHFVVPVIILFFLF